MKPVNVAKLPDWARRPGVALPLVEILEVHYVRPTKARLRRTVRDAVSDLQLKSDRQGSRVKFAGVALWLAERAPMVVGGIVVGAPESTASWARAMQTLLEPVPDEDEVIVALESLEMARMWPAVVNQAGMSVRSCAETLNRLQESLASNWHGNWQQADLTETWLKLIDWSTSQTPLPVLRDLDGTIEEIPCP